MKIFAIGLLLLSPLSLSAQKWEKEISALETKAGAEKAPKGAHLFVGSSSIRMWDLKKSFPGLKTMNHGFGGSQLVDSLDFADRIVIPFAPKSVLLYAGDNDIGGGKTAEVVVADFEKFATKVHEALPNTQIAFLPIKPSVMRWKLWPEMARANAMIKALTEKQEHLHYLDTATPMFGEDGKPKPDLFKEDGLHMNESGYALWNKVVAAWLATLE